MDLNTGNDCPLLQDSSPRTMEKPTTIQNLDSEKLGESSAIVQNKESSLPGNESFPGDELANNKNDIQSKGALANEHDHPDTTIYFDASQTFERDHSYLDDITTRIPLMYRLIDIVYENGSVGQGGLVEKFIVDQDSLGKLLNKLAPGSFRSISNIDFKSLDEITVKPKGVYGIRSEIVKFLLDLGIIDVNVARLLSRPDTTLEGLRSGLYFALRPGQDGEGNKSRDVFLIYWPEETTWCDDAEAAIQRNRATFMRYLTQLSDQVISLVSKDQADAFIWKTIPAYLDTSVGDDDDEDDDGRMFVFEVQKSEDQEENVIASPGFKVEIPSNLFVHHNVELVGGEKSVGILTSCLEPAKTSYLDREDNYNDMALRHFLSDKRYNLRFGTLDSSQLERLTSGLRERCPEIFTAYDNELTLAKRQRDQKSGEQKCNIQSQVRKEVPEIEQAIRHVWRAHSRAFERYLPPSNSSSEQNHSYKSKYTCIESLSRQYANRSLNRIRSELFQELKTRIIIIRAELKSQESSEKDQLEFINKRLDEPLDELKGRNSTKKGVADWFKSFGSSVKHATLGDGNSATTSKESQVPADIDDVTFLRELDKATEGAPALQGVRERIIEALRDYLSNEEHAFVQQQTPNAKESILKLRMDQSREMLQSELEQNKRDLRTNLWVNVRKAMDQETRQPLTIQIDHIQYDRRRSRDLKYQLRTRHITSHSPHKQYAFYPLKPRKSDLQRQSDEEFIPQPRVQWDRAEFTFKIEEHFTLEFIQPMHDRCLVVIASSEKVLVYISELSQLDGIITSKPPKSTYDRARLGARPIYAYDETTRTFAISHGEEEPRLTWVEFDERFSLIKASRTISLAGWHATSVMQKMCFVAGSTQLCLIDQSGFARVLSLDSEQFGPAHVQLSPHLKDVFSAPDGSCLFAAASNPETNNVELRAYHWASFGTTAEGLCPTSVPPNSSSYRVMAFDKNDRCHLVMLNKARPYTVSSTALLVKQKSAKFDFKAHGSQSKSHNQKTVNNCLIDCHVEVWLRFPVVPAIPRNILSTSQRQPRTITFVSEGDFDEARSYFSKLIEKFEKSTQKPTDGKLFAIAIQSLPKVQPFAEIPGSCFRFGGYLVELLCLIPIQLAVTQENNFIPLKDGVLNPAFERELLGADVPTIISSLSLGWYESLFQTYLPTKPVRVVSSMGEQSVADTSFAGSAMRTTEGIWLSCTPTEDYLLVALDFEGVQSIERSAQEDALLVLFNSAISNMVLFRNNFAISRNISTMFKSFQSSATILDPDLNPGLFNSDLAIVIKDVIGSDKKDIVREFSEKFQSIVQEEQGQNFITRLHRGRLNIIPWPVIKSRNFYTLFSGVRDALEKRPFTYAGSSVFLHTLKTLMAKIKANDWGALDQNLATHRARQLAELLPNALSRGAMEIETGSWGCLKELDTDQELRLFSDDVFWVPDGPDVDEPEFNFAEQRLKDLIQKHGGLSSVRYETPEGEFIASLQRALDHQLSRRVEHVQDFALPNASHVISCASGPNAMQESIIVEPTINAFTLVRLKKGTLLLHIAVYSQDILDVTCASPQNTLVDNNVRFGLEAVANLYASRELTMPIPVTIYVLPAFTRADSPVIFKEPHKMWLELLGPFVLVYAKLPGIKNTKNMSVQASSRVLSNVNCVRASVLHPITFMGWSLTRSTSAVKNMPVQIYATCRASVRLKHNHPQLLNGLEEGTSDFSILDILRKNGVYHHVHSVGAVVFHFCDVQCPQCEYYCTLPLGHPQQHETSHGSMIKTRWLLDGPSTNASYELQDRKYGSGDRGSTVLCSLLCSQQGRHAHVDYCRQGSGVCGGDEHQHINTAIGLNPGLPKDWISHRLYWARSGFKDPYSRNEQVEFAKCDSHCAGPEHRANSSTPANPSYCTMAIFHKPVSSSTIPKKGYVSTDGHVFECNNPFQDTQNYHIVFVIDNSTSMKYADQRPIEKTPITSTLKSSCNNRYGAVISALYMFWKSRETANTGSSQNLARADAYSILTFSEEVTHHASNDFSSTPEQLIKSLLPQKASYGTNFESAIRGASAIIEKNWDTTRTPVVIFLSDGEGSVSDESMLRLCQRCAQLEMPLAFYAISFSSRSRIPSLERMAYIAAEIYKTAWLNKRLPKVIKKVPCEYMDVNGALELVNKFLVISKSLQKPRGALIGSQNNRIQTPGDGGLRME
ncbi:Sterol 3-beta-glucosyltransferase [Rhizoctonia solani]|uniref:Sterol 3-beta-glucosyltransferase n=1 Tax=Rhizoctonia solani TaxID=456999 RepID=A0A0K6G706_9AGAM|nr:Sterol 3-beta-glucosyltransferase [Rhizoctonia solani]